MNSCSPGRRKFRPWLITFRLRAASSALFQQLVGQRPRSHRPVPLHEDLDERFVGVLAPQISDGDPHVLHVESELQILKVDRRQLRCPTHHVLRTEVAVQEVWSVRRCSPQRIQMALLLIDCLDEH